jgi:outer membrane protein assembly factor BamB
LSDYPQWRGPRRDGISPERGLLSAWPTGGPKLLWQRKDIGYGYGSPSVVGNRVLVLGNEGTDNEFVQALDSRSGRTLWKIRVGKVGNPDQQPSYPGARTTPTVDGKLVYALGSDGDLVCLDINSGKTLWTKHLRTDFGGTPGIWAYSESPLVDGDRVIVTPGGAEKTLVALNKKTGAVLWTSAIPEGEKGASYSSAVVATIGGVRQYIQFLPKGVVGLEALSGRVLWRYKNTVDPRFGMNAQTPVVLGDSVYTAAGNSGGLVNLVRTGAGFDAQERWLVRNTPCTLGGTVFFGGNLYGTNYRELVCTSAAGKILWQSECVGAASVCLAEGNLYVHGESGEVALVEASPLGFKEKGRFTPGERPEHLRGRMEKSWAYPVVADKKLWLRDVGTLWCYDIGR